MADEFKFINQKSKAIGGVFEEALRKITKDFEKTTKGFERRAKQSEDEHEKRIDAIERKYNKTKGGVERVGRELSRDLLAGSLGGQLLLTFGDMMETIYPKSARMERKKEKEEIKRAKVVAREKAVLDEINLEHEKKQAKFEEERQGLTLKILRTMAGEEEARKENVDIQKKENKEQKVGEEGKKSGTALTKIDSATSLALIHRDLTKINKREEIELKPATIQKRLKFSEKVKDRLIAGKTKLKEFGKKAGGAIKQAAMDFLPLLLILLPPLLGALIRKLGEWIKSLGDMISDGLNDVVLGIRTMFSGGKKPMELAKEDVEKAVTSEEQSKSLRTLNRWRVKEGKKEITTKDWKKEYGKKLGTPADDKKFTAAVAKEQGWNLSTSGPMKGLWSSPDGSKWWNPNEEQGKKVSGLRQYAKGTGYAPVGQLSTIGEKGKEGFISTGGAIIPNSSPLFGGAGNLISMSKKKENEKMAVQQQMNDRLVTAITTTFGTTNGGTNVDQRVINRDWSPISELLRYIYLVG